MHQDDNSPVPASTEPTGQSPDLTSLSWRALLHVHVTAAAGSDPMMRRYLRILVVVAAAVGLLVLVLGVAVALVLGSLPWWLAGGAATLAAGVVAPLRLRRRRTRLIVDRTMRRRGR